MAKNTAVRKIDVRRNGSVSAVVSVGGGGGSVDTSSFMLIDGTRAMTGVLNMGTNAITNVGNVDGVDISAHAANANAHHNQVHVLANAGGLGSDHTISGGVAGYVLRAASATTAMIAQLQHSDLGGVTANQHHNQVHSIIGSDHTITGTAVLDLVGVPSVINTLGIVTPSASPGATSKVLKTDSTGQTTIKKLIGTDFVQSSAYVSAATYVETPRITETGVLLIDPSSDIELEPGGAVTLKLSTAFKSVGATSGWTGNGFMLGTSGGAGYLELENLVVRGTMRVYELVIQRIRATNGAVAVTSTGKAETVTGVDPNFTIVTVEDHGFAAGDIIRAQTWSGSGSDLGIYRSDLTVVALDGTTPLRKFTATKRSGSSNPRAGMEFVRLGNTSDTTRQGLLYLTADELFGPYMDVTNGVTSHADWEGGSKVKLRIGNLQGVTSDTTDYGMVAFSGTYDSDTTPTVRLSTRAFEIKNVGLEIFSAGTVRVQLNTNGTMYLKDSSGSNKLAWNGSALTVDGSGTFSGSITATSGLIAGWSIISNAIQSSNELVRMVHGGAGVGRFEVRNNNVGDSTTRLSGIMSRSTTSGVVFFAGATTDYTNAASAPFTVTMAGALKASSAEITNPNGSITLDDNGVRVAANTTWDVTRGFLFKAGTTNIGGMLGQYAASNYYSTGIFANTIDSATAVVTGINVTNYIAAAASGTTKFARIDISARHATGYLANITLDSVNAGGSIVFTAGDGSGYVAVQRGESTYEVLDDYNALTKGFLKSSSTDISLTGTGYLQTAQKLGAAWTTLTTGWTDVTGAMYVKRFGDMVMFKGFIQSSNASTSKVNLITNLPSNCRPSGTIYLNTVLSDTTPVKLTITNSATVTCNVDTAKNLKDVYMDGLFYMVS